MNHVGCDFKDGDFYCRDSGLLEHAVGRRLPDKIGLAGQRRLPLYERKKNMKNPKYWADFSIAEMFVGVIKENEEITLKELSNRLRPVNSGHRIYTNAINKAISLFLTEVLIPIGKDTWKINSFVGKLKEALKNPTKISE